MDVFILLKSTRRKNEVHHVLPRTQIRLASILATERKKGEGPSLGVCYLIIIQYNCGNANHCLAKPLLNNLNPKKHHICKGSFGGCQGQPSARPWHLLIRSLGLAALLSSSSVRLLYEGYCLPSLSYRPLPSTPL